MLGEDEVDGRLEAAVVDQLGGGPVGQRLLGDRAGPDAGRLGREVEQDAVDVPLRRVGDRVLDEGHLVGVTAERRAQLVHPSRRRHDQAAVPVLEPLAEEAAGLGGVLPGAVVEQAGVRGGGGHGISPSGGDGRAKSEGASGARAHPHTLGESTCAAATSELFLATLALKSGRTRAPTACAVGALWCEIRRRERSRPAGPLGPGRGRTRPSGSRRAT